MIRAILTALIVAASVAAVESPPAAPFLSSATRDKLVPNSYLVKLNDNIGEIIAKEHFEWVQQVHAGHVPHRDLRRSPTVSGNSATFNGLTNTFEVEDFRGYTVHVDLVTAEKIRNHPDVEFIEPEPYMYASLPSIGDIFVESSQESAPWGLGRVSHQDHENKTWPYTYTGVGLGAGVDVYVLDTGVFAEHEEFEGRISDGTSVVPGEATYDDLMGHGTHCSGTIAGKTYGVAKDATIVPVKVLGANGAGGASLLAKGMEWATMRHLRQVKAGDPAFRGSVFSMSLGGARSELVNRLASRVSGLGVHLVAAAGNEAQDACTMSPASSVNGNWGSCVDLNAPGFYILSAGLKNKTGESVQSGSSMACPHVSGVVASLLSRRGPDSDSEHPFTADEIKPWQLKLDLLSITTKGVLNKTSLPTNTTNKIVYSGGAMTDYKDIINRGGWPECCQ